MHFLLMTPVPSAHLRLRKRLTPENDTLLIEADVIGPTLAVRSTVVIPDAERNGNDSDQT